MTRPCIFNAVLIPDGSGRYYHIAECGETRCTKSQHHYRNCCCWREGVGTVIGILLACVGVTQERWRRVFGDCNCEKRKQLINRFGYRIGWIIINLINLPLRILK